MQLRKRHHVKLINRRPKGIPYAEWVRQVAIHKAQRRKPLTVKPFNGLGDQLTEAIAGNQYRVAGT